MAGGDQNELIDFDTTCSDLGRAPGGVSSKPLLPAPLSSLGMCDYGENPFDQLMDLTNKKLIGNDDPFDMVFEKAYGNIPPETKDVKDSYSKETPSKYENTSVCLSRPEFTNMQLVNNSLNDSDDIHESGRSGGLFPGTRKEKVVNTAKLLDLPSPNFVRTFDETVESQEENKTSFNDLKRNSSNKHEENSSSSNSETNRIPVQSEQSDVTPVRTRRYSASDIKVKAFIAERVEKCIQKALNDSKDGFRSGSVTDLRCFEGKTEVRRHRRSYSFSSVPKSVVQSPDNGIGQNSMMGIRSNSPWVRSGTSFGDNLNTGFYKSGSARFSRSFDDLYEDISCLDAKITWKRPDEWKIKEMIVEKCCSEITRGMLADRQGHGLRKETAIPVVEVCTVSDDDSVCLEARSVSYMCEKAEERGSLSNEPYENSIGNIKPPWGVEDNYEDTILEPDKSGQQEQEECSGVQRCSRLKSDDSKVFCESNLSLDSSTSLNPVTHSTPVQRKDTLRALAVFREPKISPLLRVVPVLGKSGVSVTQKLRPVRAASEQEQKKGPLKAVAPVFSMTRTTKNGEAVADQSAGKISQNVTTQKAESVTAVSSEGKKPLRTGSVTSSPHSQKRVNKTITSPNTKEDSKIQPIRRTSSVSNTQSPSSSKNIKNRTPLSNKGPRCSPRMEFAGRERTRSYDVKQLSQQKPLRKSLQKSRSATSVPLVQSTTARALSEKNPVDSAKDKKSSANIQKTVLNMPPKVLTPIRKITSKLGLYIRGKENLTQ